MKSNLSIRLSAVLPCLCMPLFVLAEPVLDEIIVTASLGKLTRASFEIEQNIYRDSIDGDLLIKGGVTAAYLAADSMKPKRIPRTFFEENAS